MDATVDVGTAPRPIRVLLIIDSPVLRQVLTRDLSRDSHIQVVDCNCDPVITPNTILPLRPDVILLDMEMPRRNSIALIQNLMERDPLPILVLSSPATAGARTAVEALAAGAVDVLSKPSPAYPAEQLSATLIDKIKIAAHVHVTRIDPLAARKPLLPATTYSPEKIIALGASAGGVQALTQILTALPRACPGCVIVQSMPAPFTASFAQRLKSICSIEVKEAADGDVVQPGRALIAPGGMHMLLRRSGNRYYVDIKDGPEVYHQKPSVELLFNSVARVAGPSAIGALLSGCGADGAAALLNMRKAGAHTLAQDPQTCAVSDMPTHAIAAGAAESIVPLQNIAQTLLNLATQVPAARSA